jgi:Ca2+/Na+ antiporter
MTCDLIWGDQSNESVGPFGIDYAYIYECSPSNLNPLIILIFFLWIIYLINLLAQTAGNYLSPTLSKICEHLHVAYDVAGVTFLAFGNGAPDFFSLIASFSGGVDILVGVGALLGGSMFVCCVVVGSIAILSPCEVSKRIFLRDISFHITAVCFVLLVALIKHIHLWFSFLLFALYISYVVLVVLLSSKEASKMTVVVSGDTQVQLVTKDANSIMVIQTAFWHADCTIQKRLETRRKQQQTKGSMKPGVSTISGKLNAQSITNTTSYTPSSNSSTINPPASTGNYSFLLLSNLMKKDAADDSSDPNHHKEDDGIESHQHGKESNNTIKSIEELNLSGGGELAWEEIVNENYFSLEHMQQGTVKIGEEAEEEKAIVENRLTSKKIKHNTEIKGLIYGSLSEDKKAIPMMSLPTSTRRTTSTGVFQILGDDDEDDEEDHRFGIENDLESNADRDKHALPKDLQTSLLSPEDQLEEDENTNDDDIAEEGENSVHNTARNSIQGFFIRGFGYQRLPSQEGNRWKLQKYAPVLASMYWQQWALRRGFKHRIQDEWAQAESSWEKMRILIESPATFLRDLTIPTLDESQWNKLVAVFHPFTVSLFLLYILQLHHALAIGIILLWILLACMCSTLIYLFSNTSRPPHSVVFAAIWSLSAFAMCVLWIYALAGELITILSVLGKELRLPPAFLGLTVLAWGNSIGDFFTNTAVARQGFGTMALAGCYGGPVFNILIGFGSSLFYATLTAYPKAYFVELDASSFVSMIFILFALLSTMAIVSYREYRMDREFGIYLITLYVLYSVAQAILVVYQRS